MPIGRHKVEQAQLRRLIFLSASGPTLGPTKPPNQWTADIRSPELKPRGHKTVKC
jgi:hypothetical protein